MSSEVNMDQLHLLMTLTAQMKGKAPVNDEEPLAEELQLQLLAIRMWNGRGFPIVHIDYVPGRTTPENVAYGLSERGVLDHCDVKLFIQKVKMLVSACLADPTTLHVQNISLSGTERGLYVFAHSPQGRYPFAAQSWQPDSLAACYNIPVSASLRSVDRKATMSASSSGEEAAEDSENPEN